MKGDGAQAGLIAVPSRGFVSEKISLLPAANLLVEWFHLDLPDEGRAVAASNPSFLPSPVPLPRPSRKG